jgi:peptide/nickel transport system substrate-binding protein
MARRTQSARRKPAIEIVGDNVAEPLTRRDRETLADAVDSFRDGHSTRRGFIRTSAAFGLSLTSLSALVAGCGASPNQTGGGGSGGGSKTAKLAIGVNADADTVDPQAFKTIPGYYMLANLYDQLIDFEAVAGKAGLVADGSKTAPMIARSMEVSPDRRTFTFALDPKATFSDGSPLTADDVKYTFQRGVEGEQYTRTVMGMLTLSSAKNITVVDPQTIRFKLDESNPMAERLLNLQVMSIQSKKIGEQHATSKSKWADDYWRQNVYGNSAYTLKNWNRGEGWELAPSQKYYRSGLPKNGGLVFRILSDPQERLNLLKSGTLHVAYDVPAKDAAAIRDKGDGQTKLVNIPSPWSFGLSFNNSQEPFKDKRVRQALSYAVPYDQIITTVMHGLARPAKSMVPPGMGTHDPSAWKYDTNLQTAKQLLAAAGHPDGFKSSIDVLIGRPEDEQAATLIQANFRQIGVEVDVRKLAEAEYQDKRNNAASPMQIVEFYSWVTDPFYHLYFNLFSKNTFTNSSRYASKQVDSLITRGLYEPDQAKREALSHEAQKLIIDDAPWAWLFARDFFVPVAANLQDFPLWPDQNPRFYWSHLS